MSTNSGKVENFSNQSLGLDEFGVIRDDPSKSSNSYEDPALNLTDDDFSENILTVETSDAHNDETESLTEFEEIERLIKAHTVAESDEELPELPVDLEQHILSGRVSRASNSFDALAGDDDDSTANDGVTEKYESQAIAGDRVHQDTGYASGGHASTTFNVSDQVATGDLDDIIRDPPRSCEASRELSFSSNEIETGEVPPQQQMGQEVAEDDPPKQQIGLEVERDGSPNQFAIPTNRLEVGDTHQPDSLVATFGTTEDFEKLLLQQLEDSEGDDAVVTNRFVCGGGDAFEASLRKDKLIAAGHGDWTTSLPTSGRSARKEKNKLHLTAGGSRPSHQKQRPRNPKNRKPPEVRQSSGGRSPAAGRVKRAITGARVVRSSYRDSSDDLSVRSDVSRTELRSKLKEEARSRKQDEEFMNELKTNYDALLMKYAEAENTIDHLRLGAKINLYASIPHPHESSFDDPHLEHPAPQITTTNESTASQVSVADSDPLVQSSLQLPAAATKEFFKVALQLQAKDVKDKVGSFDALLRETKLSSDEREQAMASIEGALQALESDYLHAIDQHADEQRRASIATGGAIYASQGFDPDQSMETEIVELGHLVKEFRRRLNDAIHQPCDEPSLPFGSGMNHRDEPLLPFVRDMNHRNEPSLPFGRGTSHRKETMSDLGSSPDVEQQFNQLLHRYQPPAHDDHTTAPSLVYSDTCDEENTSRVIADHYLKPSSSHNDSLSPMISGSPLPDSPKSRGGDDGGANPSPRPRNSKLPRPVARPRDNIQTQDAKKTSTNAGTDSGFVGSESSRQSAAARLHPSKIKLLTAPPSVPVEVRKAPDSRSVPGKRAHLASIGSTSTRSDASFHPRSKFLPTDFVGKNGASAFRPPYSYSVDDDSVDDVSTTSTVREMLRPRSSSASPIVLTPSKSPSRRQGSTSVKSASSAPRSVASTARDSTFNMIRGEISKLRDEIKASKEQYAAQTSTPRRPPTSRPISMESPLSDDSLQVIRDDIKPHQDSDSQDWSGDSSDSSPGYHERNRSRLLSSPRDNDDVDNRGSRSRRRVRRINRSWALKDEIQKERGDKKTPESETCSAISGAPSTGRHTRSASRNSKRGERSRRSRSVDRNRSSRGGSDPEGGQRRRSKSLERGYPLTKGYWTFVPPYHPSTLVSRPQPGFVGEAPIPPILTTPTHPPVIHPSPHVFYMGPQVSPGRIYVKPHLQGTLCYGTPSKPNAALYVTPSKPNASLYVTPNPQSRLKKANVYVITSDDDDQPLTRSVLTSSLPSKCVPRSRDTVVVSLAGSHLDESLNRAEKSAEALRSHSRAVYRSARDSVYGAFTLANTL